MAATADQVSELRRMVAESTTATYSDVLLSAYIERYPLLDYLGRDPFQLAPTSSPPVREANPDWVATYDLHRAAADVWDEKAAGLASRFNFSTDIQSFSRSEAYQHFIGMARWHRSRRSSMTTKLWAYPRVDPTADQVVNAPEPG